MSTPISLPSGYHCLLYYSSLAWIHETLWLALAFSCNYIMIDVVRMFMFYCYSTYIHFFHRMSIQKSLPMVKRGILLLGGRYSLYNLNRWWSCVSHSLSVCLCLCLCFCLSLCLCVYVCPSRKLYYL